MSKLLLCIACLLLTHLTLAQDIFEWSPTYHLAKSDFQLKPANSGNGQQYYASCQIDFSYQMNNYEFMFTKNFNRFSRTIFNRKASWMDDGSFTDQLIEMAQLDFDLLELYTRKMRQRMYEDKRAFSNVNFYQQAVSEIQRQYAERHAEIVRDTDSGRSEVRTKEIHEQTLQGISELSDYCKECKPKKKKN